MVSQLVIGKNTYGSLASADTYLADSVRATSWDSLDPDTQARCLVSAVRLFEKQKWLGAASGLATILTASVVAGGSGYAQGDLLEILGGVTDSPAIVMITESAGVATSAIVIDEGLYTTLPVGTVATSGGSGSGCTLNFTSGLQTLSFPRTQLVDVYGNPLSSTVTPGQIIAAEFELAFELSVSAALEKKAGVGDNISHVGAGSAQVNFFRPTGGPEGAGSQRFPTVVQELLKPFLAGGLSISPTVSGNTDTSAFTPDQFLDFQSGLP